MLADEELFGITPKVDDIVTSQWQDIGWYIDEKGRKQFGIIPNREYKTINARIEYDTSRNRSSRPGYN